MVWVVMQILRREIAHRNRLAFYLKRWKKIYALGCDCDVITTCPSARGVPVPYEFFIEGKFTASPSIRGS